MASDQQNNQSAIDTAKIPKVTQDMIDNFSDPKPKEEESKEEVSENLEESTSEVTEQVAEISENPSEDKTVVDFVEDETQEPNPKPKRERKPFFLLKLCLLIFAILLIGAAVFGT